MTRTGVALVTGAGSGIGRAVTLMLLHEGYDVVLAGRRRHPLEEVAQTGDPDGGHSLCVPTDVGDPGSVAALFDAAVGRFDRLDLLFNNAGTAAPAVPLDEVTYEQWMAVVTTNLVGTFLCTQQAFRIMKHQSPRGGRIINNGSVSAAVPRPMSAPYTATKHAVTGLTRSTALDGRAHDIACGQIDVGNAASPLTEPMTTGVLQPDGSVRPEPVMAVERVAEAVRFMAGLPLDANVLSMTVMATTMPLVGRG